MSETKHKILIADDDLRIRRVLSVLLGRMGHEVVLASDGEEAWNILQEKDGPLIAIVDWEMPRLDGPEVCRRVRQIKGRPHAYLILLTGKDEKREIIAGIDAGADDYITKPFDPGELRARITAGERILNLQTQLLNSLAEVRQAEESLESAHGREGEIGARIQRVLLLGEPPARFGAGRIAAMTVPSQQIDGDFYDFFEHHTGVMDVFVGDVMGKGVPAALLSAAVKSVFLRTLAELGQHPNGDGIPRPETIVQGIHDKIADRCIELERFVTLCYARFDPVARHLRLVDCGHMATIHYNPGSRSCQLIKGGNMPLGFVEEEAYTAVTASFESGDVFVFYSDGVTDAVNLAGEPFGMPRLLDVIRAHSENGPEALVEAVRQAAVAHSHAETFSDDLTCVAVSID